GGRVRCLEAKRMGFLGPGGSVGHKGPFLDVIRRLRRQPPAPPSARLCLLKNCRIIGVCRASSSRKQSWPYGASITWNSTGLPAARSASPTSPDGDGGYSQSELNAISSVRAETPWSARASDPLPYCRARSK